MKVYKKIVIILILILILLGLLDFIISDELFLIDYIRGTFTETIGIIVTLIFVDLMLDRHSKKEEKAEEISKIKRSDTVISISINKCINYGYLLTTPIERRNDELPDEIKKECKFNELYDLFNPSLLVTDDFKPVVLKYLKTHNDLIILIEKALYSIDYKNYPELNKLFVEYISNTKVFDLYEGIEQDSMSKKTKEIVINMIKNHSGEVKMLESNIINKYVALYSLIKINNQFIIEYTSMINKIVDAEIKGHKYKRSKQSKSYKENKISRMLELLKFIATITVTVAAVLISSNQLKIHRFEVQPHFSVSTYYGEEMEGGKIRDLNLCIHNSGNGFYDFESNQICFIEIESNFKKIYLPLTYFFRASNEFLGSGDLVYQIKGYRNNMLLSNLKNEILNKNKDTFLNLIIFTKVKYQDITGKDHTQYFESRKGRILSNSKGKYIFELHRDYINRLSFLNADNLDYVNIDNINIGILEKYIEADIKITEEQFQKVYQ